MKILMEKIDDKYAVYDTQTWLTEMHTLDSLLAADDVCGVNPNHDFTFYGDFEAYKDSTNTVNMMLGEGGAYEELASEGDRAAYVELLLSGAIEKYMRYRVPPCEPMLQMQGIPTGVCYDKGVLRTADYTDMFCRILNVSTMFGLKEIDCRGTVFAEFRAAEDIFQKGVEKTYKNLETLYLPIAGFGIGVREFHDTPLKHVYTEYPDDLRRLARTYVGGQGMPVSTIGLRAFEKSEIETLDLSAYYLVAIGSQAFNACKNLREIRFSEGLQTIFSYAFSECTALKEFVIPSTVEEIQKYAFYHSGLQSVVLPESLKTLGKEAFADCKELQEVTIQGISSVTDEQLKAFGGCPKLHIVRFGKGVQFVDMCSLLYSGVVDTVEFLDTADDDCVLSLKGYIQNPVKFIVHKGSALEHGLRDYCSKYANNFDIQVI